MKIYYWTSLVIGIAVTLWPGIYTFRMKRYTQAELGEIDPKFQDINKAYLRHGIWAAVAFIPILVGLAALLAIDDPVRRTNLLSVYILLAFSILAFFHASFAAKYGIYPVSKYFGPNTRYAYNQPGSEVYMSGNWPSIKKLGRIQMGISAGIGITTLGILLFTSW